jgi:hypothetical protein
MRGYLYVPATNELPIGVLVSLSFYISAGEKDARLAVISRTLTMPVSTVGPYRLIVL